MVARRHRFLYLIILCLRINGGHFSNENTTADGSRAAPVYVTMTVEDVSSIQEREMRFSATLTIFFQYWANCDYLRTRSHPYVRLPGGDNVIEHPDEEMFFHPDTYFDEALSIEIVPSSKRLESTFSTQRDELNSNNVLCAHTMKTRLNVTAACLMNFEKFPMDTHVCDLSMRSYSYPRHVMAYHWNEAQPLRVNAGLRLHEFHVSVCKTDSNSSRDGEGEAWERFSYLRIRFRFQRRIQRHLVDTFLPTGFLLALCWLSLWLGTSQTQARVCLCGVLLVAVMQHLSAARESLPPSRTCTGLDLWGFLCLAFMSASILQVTMVCYYSHPEASAGSFLVSTITTRRSRRGPFMVSTVSALPSVQEQQNRGLTPRESNGGIGQEMSLERAERIDRASKVAFPVLFFVLNVAYWSWLYVS